MNYRTATVLATKTLTGAGTEPIALNLRDIISRLTLVWSIGKVKLGMSSYPHNDITKIELVDGSDVLFSMDGGQAQALNIYDRERFTAWNGVNINNNEVISFYAIDFGRWLYDTELALDPGKFRNLQLKVTFNSAVCEVGCEDGDLTVYADVFDEKVVSPIGFLMSKEHHSRTPPATGYWYVDLPTDYPLRKMLVQGYEAAYEPWYLVSEAKLDEDNEKRIPFDWNLEKYFEIRRTLDVPIQEHIAGQGDADGEALYTTPTDYWATLVATAQDGHATFFYDRYGKGGYFLVRESAGTSYVGIVKGWLPNHCFQLPFGYQKDLDDWYDVTRVGSLRLRLKAGLRGAHGTVAVVLQQLRRY